MNTYLYPWHDLEGSNQIGYVVSKSFISCKEKLSKYLIDKYEKLDDTLEYEELLEQLGELYGVYIGDIYDINEF